MDRILYLDGIPNMQRLNPVRVGEDPIEQHRLDLAGRDRGDQSASTTPSPCAREKADNGTRDLLERIWSEDGTLLSTGTSKHVCRPNPALRRRARAGPRGRDSLPEAE